MNSPPPPSPEQLALLQQARHAHLLKIWAGARRRLTPEERAEIEHLLPPEAAAESNGEPSMTAPVQPALPRKIHFAKNLRDYEPTYETGERAMKRWVSLGRAAHDLPPLDDPPSMAAWWRRHMKQRVPDKLAALEKVAPPAPAPDATMPAATTPPAANGTNGEGRIIELAGLGMEEGEAVRQARAIAQANYQRVEEASRCNKDDDYRRWFPAWKDAMEQMRKLEKEDRDARKASGSLISRNEVLTELSQLLEALRIMRDAMPAKILAELGKADQRRVRRIVKLLEKPLRDAIEKVRDGESAIFLNLESLTSPAAATLALQAA